MPENTTNLFNLGSLGVNVDLSPLHIEDGEFVSAQNCTQDKHGTIGAVTKRPGLTKYAPTMAAGALLGFIAAPLGPGPGAGTDDASVYFIGDTAGTWFTSSNSFGTSSTIATIAASGFDVISAMLNNRLYYASGTTIRVFDGVVDALFANIGKTILFVGADKGLLYVSVLAGGFGFVYELDTVGRVERQIGTALPGGYTPHSLILHQNDLYACCTKSGSVSQIYRIRLETALTTTAWILDYTSVEADVDISGLASFSDGLLYVSTDTSTVTPSLVLQRSAVGVYATVDTGVSPAGANHIIVYQGNLYAHWDSFTGPGTNSVVRQSSNGTVWTTVLSYASGGRAKFFSTGSKLFVVGIPQTIGFYSATGSAWTQFTVASAMNPAFGFFRASGPGASFGSTASFELVQGGSSLQLYNSAGTLNTLTLPTGIVLDTSRPPRFAVFNKYVVIVNTPSRPITIDGAGVTRVLTPIPPTYAITLTSGGAGGLTGSYKALQTYILLDEAGNVISESDFSPAMESYFVATANSLIASSLNISPDMISGSRIYRTTTNGIVYFQWIDVNGNTLTSSVADDQSDASLSLIAAPILGTAPNMSLIANWRGRLWGVDRGVVDRLRYSEAGVMYSWPNTNDILVGKEGSDIRGITALLPRRDALGAGRRDSLTQITGTSNQDFRSVILTENVGVESQESVVIYRDTAYFLWKDGVYKWNSEGIESLTDAKVSSWFLTDNYFNRTRFQYSFATIDQVNGKYRLYLASAGSNVEDRWIEYDIDDETWWGPHKTSAFAPTSAGFALDAGDHFIPVVGSLSGFLWKDQLIRTDDINTPIDFDIVTKRHASDTPDIEKYWGEMSIFGVAQAAGLLTITPSVGELTAGTEPSILFDLTRNRQRLRRLGVGKHAQLRLRENTANQNVIITGYELPNFEVGRR